MIKSYKEYIDKVTKLIDWAHSYYVLDNPKATDEEYDKLYHLVKDYEDKNPDKKIPNSPTNKIGGLSDNFTKVKHINKMWSQKDIFTEDELLKWYENIYNKFNIELEFSLEPKYDGMSLKLIYDNGIFIKAVTRGNGEIGEDVTENARTISSIPKTISIKKYIEVNGEVIMSHKDFIKLNEDRDEQKLSLFANPRNAAAGSMRLLDSKEVAKRKLSFYPWELVDSERQKRYTHNELMKYLENIGFNKRPMYLVTKSIKKIIEFYNKMYTERNNLPMSIDGMMIKINDYKYHNILGYTAKYPRWSVAFKFPAVEVTTKIKNIISQVGRTGIVTPVAILEPVHIDGSMVERVTLHNFEEICRKDIRIGDIITIIKSGDIIPKITNIFKDRRDNNIIKFIPPSYCPVCNYKLTKEDVYLRCENPDCYAKLVRRIMFFASRDYMNIEGLGESVAEALVENNLVRSPLDLYSLSYEKLELLDGFGDKKIKNLLNAIENSKNITLDRFIAALGIPGFGRTLSKDICSKVGREIFNYNVNQLIKFNGISKIIANNFVNYVKTHSEYIQKMLEIVQPIDIKKSIGKYSGMNIALTGVMEGGKNKIKELLESQGGIIKSSVTRDTDLVVYGENPGSKLNKAKELGIKTIHYREIQNNE